MVWLLNPTLPANFGFANTVFGNALAIRVRDASLAAVQITLINRQRRVRFEVERLRELAALSLAECARHSSDGMFALKKIPVIEVAVVSDAVIARVHVQFMDVPGATDVITFAHGEIVVSADTARVQAAEHGHDVVAELALYILHGLLHLNGYDDIAPRDRAKMHRVQDRIWRKVLRMASDE